MPMTEVGLPETSLLHDRSPIFNFSWTEDEDGRSCCRTLKDGAPGVVMWDPMGISTQLSLEMATRHAQHSTCYACRWACTLSL